ncbi:hypothetical protein KUCAC02_034691 [Chaenocephalus aceratus]|nr:hypothetical protein KUCAC02_034691 [Chaenocephalus aceratus]
MAAYFGHSVAATDVNNDGLVDLFVGAPLFMDRGSDGKLREVGQVSVYMGRGGFSFHPPQLLTGSEVYARYGSAIAALGDLDMDGYNDIAVSAPYGGPDHHGLVYIHNGRPKGPDSSPSQVLQGKWASSYMPASFGYSMTGNTDIDQNGYPDLLVGVFGADKAYCVKASGRGAPATLNFRVDLLLDRLKQKEATKRVLFLHSRAFHFSKNVTVSNGKGPACEEQSVFLRDDRDFRDKITPISVAMEFSLDYQRAADAHILLDCGDDNICKPDLRLSVKSDRDQIYIGDDNALTLEISAENQGEGAYEAELHVYPPSQADFTGVVRSQTLSRLSCAYKKENQTKMVVCDLGNPMKGGTKVLAELRFSVHQLSEEDTYVKFDVQMVSSNQFDNTSPRVSSITQLAVLAKVLLPIANWKPREPPVVGDDIGPQIVHVYEYRNGSRLYITSFDTDGPINCTTDIEINPRNNPLSSGERNTSSGGVASQRPRDGGEEQNHVKKRELETRDSQNDDCSTAQCLRLKCQVGRLERRKNAILFIYSRLAVNNFLRTENQNRSYVVRSTATFNVIQMPYKNLVSELPSNSTTLLSSQIQLVLTITICVMGAEFMHLIM